MREQLAEILAGEATADELSIGQGLPTELDFARRLPSGIILRDGHTDATVAQTAPDHPQMET